jgi:hypothetical protein
MTNQTLAATVARILRQPFIQKIGFDLHGLTVTGMRYSMVAKAVEDGKIECHVESDIKPKTKDELAEGTKIEAQYRPSQNAMVFSNAGYGSLGWEERTIFHEATHAIFDLYASSSNDQTLAIEDETAAVLAEAHYVRLSPRPTGNFAMWVDGRGERALKVVDAMIAATGNFERDKRTYFLRPDQTANLREAVAADWHFTKYKDSQGFDTDSTGVKYIYDGVVSCFSCWASGR